MKIKHILILILILLTLLGLVSAAVNVIFSDNFDRSNSATVGNGWTEDESGGGTAAIASNKLALDAGGDGYVFLDRTLGTLSSNGLAFNLTVKSNNALTGSGVNWYICDGGTCGPLRSGTTIMQWWQDANNLAVCCASSCGSSDTLAGYSPTNTYVVSFYDINFASDVFNWSVNGAWQGQCAFNTGASDVDAMTFFGDDNGASNVDVDYDDFVIWNVTADAAATYVFINNTQYNFSAGYNNTDQTIWRTNQSYPARTYDPTPDLRAFTNRSSNGTISNCNLNFTSVVNNATCSYYNCSEVNSTTHTCTYGSTLPYGVTNLYLAFQGSNSTLSTSGALVVNVVEQELITVTAPVNLSYKYDQNTISVSTTTQGIGTTGLNISHFIYFSNGTLATNQTQLNGGVNFTSNYTLSPGNYFVNASARNGTTYTVTSGITNFTVFSITKGNISSPSNNSVLLTKNMTLNWTNFTTSSAGSNITRYNATLLNSTYGLNATLFSNAGLNLSANISLSALRLSPGNYYIRLYATDSQNNSVYQEINLTTLSLQTAIASPEDGAFVSSSNFTLTYSANGTNLQSCLFYWQGSLNATQNLTEAGTFNFNKTGLTTTATYEYYLICNDSLGNTNNSGSRTVQMDVPGSVPAGGGSSGTSSSGTPVLQPASPPVQNTPVENTKPQSWYSKATDYVIGNLHLEEVTLLGLGLGLLFIASVCAAGLAIYLKNKK